MTEKTHALNKLLHFLFFGSGHNSCSRGKFLWLKLIMRNRVGINLVLTSLDECCGPSPWEWKACLGVHTRHALFICKFLCISKEHTQLFPLFSSSKSDSAKSRRIGRCIPCTGVEKMSGCQPPLPCSTLCTTLEISSL